MRRIQNWLERYDWMSCATWISPGLSPWNRCVYQSTSGFPFPAKGRPIFRNCGTQWIRFLYTSEPEFRVLLFSTRMYVYCFCYSYQPCIKSSWRKRLINSTDENFITLTCFLCLHHAWNWSTFVEISSIFKECIVPVEVTFMKNKRNASTPLLYGFWEVNLKTGVIFELGSPYFFFVYPWNLTRYLQIWIWKSRRKVRFCFLRAWSQSCASSYSKDCLHHFAWCFTLGIVFPL